MKSLHSFFKATLMIHRTPFVLYLMAAVLIGLPAVVFAQQPPYDVFPPADPPYYRVRYEASAKPGELLFPVNYTIWVPPGVKELRGVIVHQHGCGEGSCKSGLTGAYDLHWQALAKKHDCALLAPSYEQPEKADCQMWCDPRNGSGDAFRKCLSDLGMTSGHPELPEVPWALWGHSGGGHWAGGMVMQYPNRVAAAWLRSGVPLLKPDPERPTIKAHMLPDAALRVPLLCNLGTKEGVTVKGDRFADVWPANEAFFNEMRGQGGLISVAVDPLTAHECGNQRYFAIPWLDACLTSRLPKSCVDPLHDMPTEDAWLAIPSGFEAVPAAKFAGDPLKAAWLPNEAIARAWMQYVRDTAVTDTTAPPAPANLRTKGNELSWEAQADLESGLAGFIIERDGEFLANLPEQGKNPFGRPIFQNLQYSDTPTQPLVPLQFTDSRAVPGKKHTYRVFTVNTVGLKSEPIADFPDPIAHWQFDDEGGEARDSAGTHHGTIQGAVPHAGKSGKALLFNRPQGDYVSIPHSPDFEISTFTVSAWVRLTKEPTFSGILGTRAGGEFNFDMKVNADKVHGDIGDGARWIDTKINFYKDDVGSDGQGGDLATQRWYLVTFVIDNEHKECRLYLDGDRKKTIPFQGEPRLMRPGQTMTIGNTGAGEFMDGVIDDVRIWKHALTDQQVLNLIAP
jgi:hypothetical protein